MRTCARGHLWTRQQQGCPFLEPLSFGRSPAAPSSAQGSRQGTGESWRLKEGGGVRAKSHSVLPCLMITVTVSLCGTSIVYSMPKKR